MKLSFRVDHFKAQIAIFVVLLFFGNAQAGIFSRFCNRVPVCDRQSPVYCNNPCPEVIIKYLKDPCCEEELCKARNQIKCLEKDIGELKCALEKANAKKAEIQKLLEIEKIINGKLNERIKNLENSLAESLASINRLNGQLNDLKEKLIWYQKEYEKSLLKIDTLNSKIKSLEDLLAQSEKDKKYNFDQWLVADREVVRLKAAIGSIKNQKEVEVSALNMRISDLTTNLANAVAAHKECEQKLQNQARELEKANSELTSSKIEMEKLRKELQGSKEDLGDSEKKVASQGVWVLVLAVSLIILALAMAFLMLLQMQRNSQSEKEAAIAREQAVAALREMAANKKDWGYHNHCSHSAPAVVYGPGPVFGPAPNTADKTQSGTTPMHGGNTPNNGNPNNGHPNNGNPNNGLPNNGNPNNGHPNNGNPNNGNPNNGDPNNGNPNNGHPNNGNPNNANPNNGLPNNGNPNNGNPNNGDPNNGNPNNGHPNNGNPNNANPNNGNPNNANPNNGTSAGGGGGGAIKL